MRLFSRKGLVWVTVITLVIIFIMQVVNPIVFNYGYAELEALTIKSVNKGIREIADSDMYPNLTKIEKNSSGAITNITADIISMNRIASEIADKAQENLNEVSEQGIPIPIGTFSGLPILVGKGFPVMLEMNLIGSVNCSFDSSFTSAGINQTHHKILLEIEAVANLIMPLYAKQAKVTLQILFADNIIVGEVPEFLFTK